MEVRSSESSVTSVARNRLDGRNAIVTGAGSGIGQAIAIGLARHGAGVIAADVDAAAAERTAGQIRADGGRAVAVTVDVAQRASVEAMLETALAHHDRVHILVSNAGVSGTHNSLDLPRGRGNGGPGLTFRGQYPGGQVLGGTMPPVGGGASLKP